MRIFTISKTFLAAAELTSLGVSGTWAQEFSFKLHHFLSAKAPARYANAGALGQTG